MEYVAAFLEGPLGAYADAGAAVVEGAVHPFEVGFETGRGDGVAVELLADAEKHEAWIAEVDVAAECPGVDDGLVAADVGSGLPFV